MDSDSVSASSSRLVEATDTVESQIDIWSAWKECEKMLKENNYMVESLPTKSSPKISQIASEMYNRIVTMFDKIEIVKDEELVFPDNDVSDDGEMQTSSPEEEDEEESEWENRVVSSNPRNFISLQYKKKVVAMAKAHPKWSLETIQKRGGALLKKKAHLKIWEAEIAAGGTMFEKYESINEKTFQRFQEARENLEEITTTTLQQWALTNARELNCENFVASTRWIQRFKRKYGIRQ
ncbi:uncharacterized protein LOC114878249 [Osmia bicornis bicornis]|uniref:uncharacterized protein LOC114878249 n=1 Tax=Osmia bicornis bicornis TaxID=1437191 RepID=UPI001EAEECB1|nr:uncharacterized protein LOC114878249 [Osmia bicornis bicornis]XP_046143070.1 uncharacterized protein LOC114878249 [Osmia bicornis bicornis]